MGLHHVGHDDLQEGRARGGVLDGGTSISLQLSLLNNNYTHAQYCEPEIEKQ